MEWHVRNTSQPTTSNKGNKGRIEEERDRAQARRSPGRKRNAKNEDPDSPMPQKVKNKQKKCTARPDRLTDNGKCMNDRQTMDLHGSGACIRLKHTHLYLANTGMVGHGLEVREGMVWWWGEGGSLLWDSCSSSFGGDILLG